jgi:hypothetical protein
MNDLSDIKYINKSIYHQLGNILNEEERIISTDYYKTNNFNFNFEAFEEKNKKNLIKSNSYCNYQDISYLNRYEEIIRDKQSNERKAEQYIKEMNQNLKKKIYCENKIINEKNHFVKERDEKKLKITTEIDAKYLILQKLHSKIRRSSSSPKCSLKLLKNNGEEKKESLIREKIKSLRKEIEELKYKQKEIDLNNKNFQIEYLEKSKNLHEEIKQLKIELNEHIKSGIEYYLEILKKGTDTRTSGLSWVVRKLLKLGYKPQLNNFPNYFDNHMIKFLIEYSKKKKENYELVNQLNEYKNNINKELRNDTFVEEKKEIRNSLQHNTENYIENKFGELLERHNSNNYFKKNINLKKCSIFPSLNLKEENKTNEKLNKSFINNEKKNEIQKIVDIKKKVEMNEHLIKKLKDDEYKYVIDKKSKNHNFDKDYKENIMKSLFGVKV